MSRRFGLPPGSWAIWTLLRIGSLRFSGRTRRAGRSGRLRTRSGSWRPCWACRWRCSGSASRGGRRRTSNGRRRWWSGATASSSFSRILLPGRRRRRLMATSASGARLTEGHRLAQARLGAQTVQLIRATWPLLDPEDLDGTLGRWLRVTVPIVRRQRRQSALLAGEYLRAFRATEVGLDSRFVPVVDVPEELEAVITSLTVTGPVAIKRAVARLVPLERALPTAEAGVAAAA